MSTSSLVIGISRKLVLFFFFFFFSSSRPGARLKLFLRSKATRTKNEVGTHAQWKRRLCSSSRSSGVGVGSSGDVSGERTFFFFFFFFFLGGGVQFFCFLANQAVHFKSSSLTILINA